MVRRLVAILAADVVGYSRLMGKDESGTLARLKACEAKVIEPLVQEHNGRVVKRMGDGYLVEFGSVVDALQCAAAWQQSTQPGDGSIQFRIGINLGDVIIEGDDIYGEGVNIAARLEELAEPGGVCVSSTVFDHGKGKVSLDFHDLGERQVKNIAGPIRLYSVEWEGRPRAFADTVASEQMSDPGAGGDASEEDINATFALPDTPSIAVLPFTNMSADPEQEFFSDGIAEDIITALSKVNGLLVVARNSTFIYKGQAVDVKTVSRDLGVRYVLEGSVRRAGRRVRVTAQLIDATTGHHLWAERFDRNVDDIFDVQDQITREVVIALEIRLSMGEQARIWSSGTKNLEAWECIRLAMAGLNSATREGLIKARRMSGQALELDPNYATAWAVKAWTYHHEVDVGVGRERASEREEGFKQAIDCAKKALELDPSCSDAYSVMSFCLLGRGQHTQAIEMSDKAVELAPNHAECLALSAVVRNKSGRPEQATQLITKAMRLSPTYPAWFLWALGVAHRLTGDKDLAVRLFRKALERNRDFLAIHVSLAVTLSELDHTEEARKSAAEILRISPGFSIHNYIEGLSYSDQEELQRIEEGLRRVGSPD